MSFEDERQSKFMYATNLLFDDDPLVNLASRGVLRAGSWIGKKAKQGIERLRTNSSTPNDPGDSGPKREPRDDGFGGGPDVDTQKNWDWLRDMLTDMSSTLSSIKDALTESLDAQTDQQEKQNLADREDELENRNKKIKPTVEKETEGGNKRGGLIPMLLSALGLALGGFGATGGLRGILYSFTSFVVKNVLSLTKTIALMILRNLKSLIVTMSRYAIAVIRPIIATGIRTALTMITGAIGGALGSILMGVIAAAGAGILAYLGLDAGEDESEILAGPEALKKFMDGLSVDERAKLVKSGFTQKPESTSQEDWDNLKKTMQDQSAYQKQEIDQSVKRVSDREKLNKEYADKRMVPPSEIEMDSNKEGFTSQLENQQNFARAKNAKLFEEAINKKIKEAEAKGEKLDKSFLYNLPEVDGVQNPNLAELEWRRKEFAAKEEHDKNIQKLEKSTAELEDSTKKLTETLDKINNNGGPQVAGPIATPGSGTPQVHEHEHDETGEPETPALTSTASPTATVPVKATDGTTKMVDLSDTSQLRGQAFAGGKTHRGVLSAAALLYSHPSMSGRFERFTGFNDAYHHHELPGSKHNHGLAFDLTLKGGGAGNRSVKAMSDIRSILMASGLSMKDFYMRDEYKEVSKGKTADHIHVQFNSKAAAEKFYEAMESQRLKALKEGEKKIEEQKNQNKGGPVVVQNAAPVMVAPPSGPVVPEERSTGESAINCTIDGTVKDACR